MITMRSTSAAARRKNGAALVEVIGELEDPAPQGPSSPDFGGSVSVEYQIVADLPDRSKPAEIAPQCVALDPQHELTIAEIC